MSYRIELYGFVNRGFSGQKVLIETDIKNGFPSFDIIGLPDATIKESKERLKAAIKNSGFKIPQKKILVSLSPASQPKSGSLLDIGIAISILFAASDFHAAPDSECIKIMLSGELTLSGDIVKNPSALACIHTAIESHCNFCFVPFKVQSLNYKNVFTSESLSDTFKKVCSLMKTFNGSFIEDQDPTSKKNDYFLSDIIGMDKEKEIMALSACGFHSILFFGPPGVGKTMLSIRLGKLLPKLMPDQQEELSRIYGCANLESNGEIPIRLLALGTSQADFNGNPSGKIPGEGALAHRGTLILDEVNKYTPGLKTAVKFCYDRGYTLNISNGQTVTYPARFLLVANMNACACGALGTENGVCTCTAGKLINYWNKADRTLLERFNIRLPVEEKNNIFVQINNGKDESYFKEKIETARDRQKFRYRDMENISCNGEVHYNTSALQLLIKEASIFDTVCKKRKTAIGNIRNQINLITLARTIADYRDSEDCTEEDFIRAFSLTEYGFGNFYWKKIY